MSARSTCFHIVNKHIEAEALRSAQTCEVYDDLLRTVRSVDDRIENAASRGTIQLAVEP